MKRTDTGIFAKMPANLRIKIHAKPAGQYNLERISQVNNSAFWERSKGGPLDFPKNASQFTYKNASQFTYKNPF